MAEALRETFGRNLRAHRRALGLNQREFGEKFGCQRTAVGAMERGEQNVTLATLQRIVDGLDLDPVELLRPIRRS